MRVLLRDLVDVSLKSERRRPKNTTFVDGESDRLQLAHERAQEAAEVAARPLPVGRDKGSYAQVLGAMTPAQIRESGGQCFLMQHVRFDAPSIKVVKATEAKECCGLCQAASYCSAFSWSPEDGGTCYLKQWSGTATQRDEYVSGHFARRASCACHVRKNTTLRAGLNETVLAHVPSPSHGQCCAAYRTARTRTLA